MQGITNLYFAEKYLDESIPQAHTLFVFCKNLYNPYISGVIQEFLHMY